MSGKHIWKLVATALLVAFCASYLVPLDDRDFATYVREKSGDPAFGSLMDRAVAKNAQDDTISSDYLSLKRLANEEKIDVSQYFPDLDLEPTLVGAVKRNDVLLPALLEMSKSSLKRGLDIKGGISVTFQVDPNALEGVSDYEREGKLADAVSIIERRVNAYGVAEPVVRPVGDDRIEVQLAGINTRDNPDILDIIKAPALLEFREVHMTARPGVDPVPPLYEEMVLVNEVQGQEFEQRLYVKQIPALTGGDVERADVRRNEIGGIYVSLDLTDEGSELFGDVTTTLAGRGRLGIVLDNELVSAPTVNEPILGGSASITGDYSEREALNLANTLNNPLEFRLEVVESYEVGPSLAKASVDAGIRAAYIGCAAVSAAMLIYYLVGGVVALACVAINILIVLGTLASFQATITLPGIAGIVLTVGMAVDANVLIFERIREELRAGKHMKAALAGGFDKVFSTILDANVTTLIVAIVMLLYGTGPVKGFGLTLAIGVASTMFGALVVSRVFLDLLFDTGFLKRFSMLSVLSAPNFDFLKYRKYAFAASWLLVAVGAVVLVSKRDIIFGIDFTGGDEVKLSYAEKLDTTAISRALVGFGEVNPFYETQIGSGQEILRLQTEPGKGDDAARALDAAFPDAQFQVQGVNEIGPTVGSEIQRNAALSIGISLGLILLYVAFRFEIGYGIGAIVATLHDVVMTLGIFAMVPGHQFTAPMVAAILLIVGYSLNDTIVVFDRIREELLLRPTAKLREVINIAMNATLARTLMTSFTTLLASGSLMFFGTGVISDIAFTFTIGIIVGTFSSIFIATPVFFWWHKGDRRSVEHSHDPVPQYEWEASSKSSN